MAAGIKDTHTHTKGKDRDRLIIGLLLAGTPGSVCFAAAALQMNMADKPDERHRVAAALKQLINESVLLLLPSCSQPGCSQPAVQQRCSIYRAFIEEEGGGGGE